MHLWLHFTKFGLKGFNGLNNLGLVFIKSFYLSLFLLQVTVKNLHALIQ